MVDIRIIIPLICIISIICIMLAIIFRRAAWRRHHHGRVRRVHPPHNTCATYTVPGCETIQACHVPTYPQAFAAQPIYYHQNPSPPQQLYPQPIYPQVPQQSYPTNQMPGTSHPEAQAPPPPYYNEAQPK